MGSDDAAVGVPGRVGICLSGGGIRSAAYSLGALQAMGERGMLRGPRRAAYLSAVSGGSYITGAVTLVARGALPGEPDGEGVIAAEDPFARGTPEEQYVRDHTTYLVHGAGGRLAFVGRLLGGIVIQLAFLVLSIHLVARPLGWLYGWAIPTLRHPGVGADAPSNVAHLASQFVHATAPAWLVTVLWVLVGAGGLFGVLSIGHRWRRERVRAALGWISAVFFVAAGLYAVFVLGVPKVLELLREHTAQGRQVHPIGAARRSFIELRNTVGAAVGALVVTGAGAMRFVQSSPTGKSAASFVEKRLKPFARVLIELLLNLLATLSGPVFLAAVFLLVVDTAAQRPVFVTLSGTGAELLWWLGGAALLGVLLAFGDLVAWSMHPLYKRRLSSTFALRRRDPGGGKPVLAEERDYTTLYPLSKSQPPDFPTVLISAAVNITDYGATRTGSNVAGFVFSAETVGGPATGLVDTPVYEQAFSRRARDFTLPTAVSITGAAVSPEMGKMTRKPLRFLLALLNIRLGVWVPNPARLADGDKLAYSKYLGGPGLGYLVNEMFGRYRLKAPYLYVSDGGHYENLGLVELLRRGCTTIWCVDASGDEVSTFHTLAEAVSLARGELGVDIEIDAAGQMQPPSGSSFVKRPWASGTIRYLDGTPGTLVVVKAGVWEDAPMDVRDFHAEHPTFPTDSTVNQLYTGERFDAYRALGYAAASLALAHAVGPGGAPLAPPLL